MRYKKHIKYWTASVTGFVLIIVIIVTVWVFPLRKVSALATNVSLSTSGISELMGEATLDAASINVVSAGDVNNDGYDDILIGTKANDAIGLNAGAAYLVYGKTAEFTSESLGSSSNTIVKFTGEAAGDYGGSTLGAAGDVNNDGYDDFLIGSYQPAPSVGPGAAYLIYGQATPYAATVSLGDPLIVKFTGEASGDYAGSKLLSPGDVNNDGYADILITAPNNDNNTLTNNGAAYLIYGQHNLLTSRNLSAADAKFTGQEESDGSGAFISGGDFNDDGFADIIISASGWDASNFGRTYLYYGQLGALTSGSLGSADAIFTGEGAEDGAGVFAVSLGDINNDNYDDFAIGAAGNDDAGSNAGAVYIQYGQSEHLVSSSLSTAIEFTGEAAGDQASNIGSAGDINNDGYDDFFIGAVFNDTVAADAGAAYLIYGQAAAFTSASLSTAAVKFTGEAAGDRAGTWVSGAGDVNNDGYNDIIISGRLNDDSFVDAGAAYIIYVRPSTITITDNTNPTNTVECATGTFIDPGATATDQYTNTSLAVSTTDSVPNTIVGNRSVIYNTDRNTLHLIGTTTRTVTVTDTAAPIIALVGNSGVTVRQDSAYTDDGVTVTDACDSAPIAITTGTVNTAIPGDYTLVYSATDASGNVATTVSRTVTVTAHGSIESATKTDGSITLTYADGYTQAVEPFSGSAQFAFALATDQQRIVVTNGKLVRVFMSGVKVDQQKINKKSLLSKFVTLKVKKLYRAKSYDDVMVILAKKTKGKVNHIRLTSAHQLTQFEHTQVDITEREPGEITVRAIKHRFTTIFGKDAGKITSIWKVTRQGHLNSTVSNT